MTSTKIIRPFAGLPVVPAPAVPPEAAAAVIGACYSLGSPHDGAENAALFLRTMSRHYTWAAHEPCLYDLRHGRTPLRAIVDIGDLDFGDAGLDEALAITERAVLALPGGVAPCVIGGDHTVTLAVVRALCRRRARPFSVVQFDHHLDLQTWDGGPAAGARRDPIFHTNVMSHVSDHLGPGRLVQVGVSPYATVESGAAAHLPRYLAGVGRQIPVTAPEIDDLDAFRAAVGTGGDVYVTVDVDVLDAAAMSATGYPAELGLSPRRLLRLLDVVAQHNTLVGFDVVEFAADRDDRSAATLADAHRAALIVLHLLSWIRRQADDRTAPAERSPL